MTSNFISEDDARERNVLEILRSNCLSSPRNTLFHILT